MEQIEGLKPAKLADLKRVWRASYRKPYPENLPRNLVIQMLAYKIQARTQGDLSAEDSRYLAKAAVSAGLPPRYGKEQGHRAGTIFVREHAGKTHRVVKTIRGYEWDGNEYKSLTAVAFAITGSKWNGPRFFGIARGKRRA